MHFDDFSFSALSFWDAFAAVNFAAWIGFWIRAVLMRQQMPSLADAPLPLSPHLPRVSVIVPARNEDAKLHDALSTLLAQTYPNLEIIAINDRSTDRTGEILDALAQKYPQLRVIHVEKLPDGWLGKNYANQLGFEHATGEYLLFTDADIFFHPETLARTVGYAMQTGVKHLVAYPKMLTSSAMEEAFIALFGFLFTWKF